MKALNSSKGKLVSSLLLFVVSLFVVIQASAHCGYHHRWHHRGVVYSPVAVCSNAVTGTPLPAYQCCQLRDKDHRVVWGNTWVAGSCTAASPYAIHDRGCSMESPVSTTGRPIEASCQFSWSTVRFK